MSRLGSRMRGVLAVTVALALCAALTACSPAMMRSLLADGADPGPEVEDSPGLFNSQLKEEAETLLEQVWQGDWDDQLSGNVRTMCDNTPGEEAYYFYGSWFTPGDATVPDGRRPAERAMAELGAWLEAEGWSALDDYEFTEKELGVNAVGISAEQSFNGIDYIQVTYYYEGDYGVDYPHIVVDIDSGCLIDDSNGGSSLTA